MPICSSTPGKFYVYFFQLISVPEARNEWKAMLWWCIKRTTLNRNSGDVALRLILVFIFLLVFLLRTYYCTIIVTGVNLFFYFLSSCRCNDATFAPSDAIASYSSDLVSFYLRPRFLPRIRICNNDNIRLAVICVNIYVRVLFYYPL